MKTSEIEHALLQGSKELKAGEQPKAMESMLAIAARRLEVFRALAAQIAVGKLDQEKRVVRDSSGQFGFLS